MTSYEMCYSVVLYGSVCGGDVFDEYMVIKVFELGKTGVPME